MSVHTIQAKKEARANVWEQMKALMQKVNGRDMTAEEIQTFDQLEADLDRRGKEIEAEERFDALSSALDKVETDPIVVPGPTGDAKRDKQYEEVFWRFMRFGGSDLDTDQRQLLRSGWRQFDDTQKRAQGVGTNSAGGYFVPQGFRQIIVETMKFFGAVRSVAQVITTDSGQTLPWPTNDDTANVGAILAENTQMTQQDVTLGQAQLGAYTYTSKLVLVSWQLLQDSIFDVPGFLGRKLGERIGRIQNQHFTTGTGSSQPLGVQTNATVGKTGTTGQTTSVIYDDLIDLIHSVDPAYRRQAGQRARFMLHDLSLAKARKLKDSQNRPLWEPSVQAGVPDTLLGYALEVNNDMPQMAANAKSILFGDFESAYVIRDVLDIQTIRLDERYADFLQSGFFAFARTDATLQDAAAVKAYQNSAT